MSFNRIVQISAIILLTLAVLPVKAQFGAGIKYQGLSTAWDESIESAGYKMNNKMLSGSLYYWFRMKDKRIEFYPEFSYSSSLGSPSGENFEVTFNTLSVMFNSDFYLFDLINDCDCPTFSKEGSVFTRGFFLEATLGMEFEALKLKSADEQLYKGDSGAFRAGIGMGVDFGLSDMITLTPFGFVHYKTTSNWEGLNQVLGNQETDSPGGSNWYTGAGIRIIFRPDYKRRFR